jgi:hypothetical protein
VVRGSEHLGYQEEEEEEEPLNKIPRLRYGDFYILRWYAARSTSGTKRRSPSTRFLG